jgi:hypothetical protein
MHQTKGGPLLLPEALSQFDTRQQTFIRIKKAMVIYVSPGQVLGASKYKLGNPAIQNRHIKHFFSRFYSFSSIGFVLKIREYV